MGNFIKGGRFPVFPHTVLYGDIRRGLPIPETSTDLIYCSHVLEHLSLEELRIALVNTFKLLKPGGFFRCVLPDLEIYINEYSKSTAMDRSERFMNYTLLGRRERASGIEGLLRSWIGGAEHLWMWDFEGLKQELAGAGFIEIRRATYGDSGIAAFDSVEDFDRWNHNLGLNCRKPG